MTIDTKKPRNKIAELRKSKKLTIQQVADGIGVSNGTISRYEQGIREPKLETWIRLADFFNVSVSYLQGVSNDEPNKPKNIDLKKDPVVLSYGGKPVSDEDMDIIKAILEKHKGINHEKD